MIPMRKTVAPPTYRCIRCGTCCAKGGPVLHADDRSILRDHPSLFEHIVVIREGELTFNPVSSAVEPAPREMLKVAGNGSSWSCYFYREEESACSIYAHRFLECRLLKCWRPSDVLAVVGRELICRFDVMNRNDPLRGVIEMQERECSLVRLTALIDEAMSGRGTKEALRILSGLVEKDEAIRSYALREVGLAPQYELFALGRPLRDMLRDAGIAVTRKSADSE